MTVGARSFQGRVRALYRQLLVGSTGVTAAELLAMFPQRELVVVNFALPPVSSTVPAPSSPQPTALPRFGVVSIQTTERYPGCKSSVFASA
ncbi:MAG TPA: hypothetical protein VN901_15275 [Candidatus Acidoferrales bacterium]|nr:hypothetical protein [Candidatus Acidoferrales bacterium]